VLTLFFLFVLQIVFVVALEKAGVNVMEEHGATPNFLFSKIP